MNRQAKATSSFTFGRKGFAAAALASLAFAALLALSFAPGAHAGKVVDRILAGGTSLGTAEGLFNAPRGIAVNYANVADGTTDPLGAPTNGYVYVVDTENHRVQVFGPDGTFKFMWGRGVQSGGDGYEVCDSSETPCKVATGDDEGGELNSPRTLAINQATGHVYVWDRNNRRIQEFEADGDFLRAWGRDVATSGPGNTGAEFEICSAADGDVCKAGTDGTAGGQFVTPSGMPGIAVAPAGAPNAGNVLVGDAGNRRIQEFGPSGAWIRAWGWDVVVPGGTGEVTGAPFNERQSFRLVGGLTGTFTLTFSGQTTEGIPYNIFTGVTGVAAEVDAKLEALPSVGPGGVTVNLVSGTINTWDVEFIGALGLTDVPLLSGDFSTPDGPGSVEINLLREGGPNPGFEICAIAAQCKASAGSEPADEPGAFAAESPQYLKVDSTGTVYAVEHAVSNRIQRFDSTKAVAGELLRSPIAVATLTGTSTAALTTGLDVDPTSGNLLVARSSNVGVLELANPAGTPTDADRHYQGSGIEPNDIAIDGAGDDLYMSTNHRVFAADDDGSPPPVVTFNPPSGVGANGAELSGTINPAGQVPTSYVFQVSKNGIDWTSVGSKVDIGTGNSPIPVATTVTGLEANVLYRVRILTTKGFGNGEYLSAELTFLTDAPPPEVKTVFPQTYTDTTALLTGHVNPNNLATTYRFQYGESTAYGTTIPVPFAELDPSGQFKAVHQAISGLEPETTYHYRLLATNAEGTTTGSDVAFTTRPAETAKAIRVPEMVTPPFKALPQFVGPATGGPLNNPNVGIPSLDGERVMWANAHFPLSDEVDSINSGDSRLMRRTPTGWTFETRNTLPMHTPCAGCAPGEFLAPTFARVYASASSGDMETISYHIGGNNNVEFLPSEGPVSNRLYTRRDGTGVEGWTGWLANPRQQFDPANSDVAPYVLVTADSVRFNDDGSAMARSWFYRDLADDPSTPLDEDPSDEQQLSNPNLSSGLVGASRNEPGGQTVYLQRAGDPLDMPSAPKDLVNECTGTGPGDATTLPARSGTGSTATIATQSCWSSSGVPEATGTGTAAAGSNMITSLSAASGSFEVGQIVKGPGIPPYTRITAKGAGTLTLSAANVAEPKAKGSGLIANGSNTITSVSTTKGTFEVGQVVRIGPEGFFGPGTGFAFDATITAVGAGTLTIDVTPSGLFPETNNNATISVNALPGIALEADSVHVTSMRGAVLGGGGRPDGNGGVGAQHTQTALSNDGNRVFFQSPDSDVAGSTGVPTTGCTTAAGPNSICVPQLFVRQYDDEGSPTVRWISRAQGVGAQRVAELGRGAFFEGASRNGQHVYFKTNAPLLPSDPNGGNSITTGAASDLSFDLYRYELPEDLDEDPANGTLTRVSGGPTGSADPSTGNSAVLGVGPSAVPVGGGGALRYLSDDGELAYFVTTSPVSGADTTPSQGAATTPGGAVGNGTLTEGTRNLYLFDDTGPSPQWRYIASLPFSTHRLSGSGSSMLNSCASSELPTASLGSFGASGGALTPGLGNCFRGTPDGKHVVFQTAGRLTGDDTDDASDIYLYDYERDELTRVSAPPQNANPYICNGSGTAFCNADVGINLAGASPELGTGGYAAGKLATARGWAGGKYYNLASNPDGTVSVFFQSKSNLVPEDDDALGRHDVYEWREGKLTLITPQFPEQPYWYSGSSLDGEDLFVNTPARLDPRELDEADYDLYDLRVGGGIPFTPPPTPCDVLAHQCRSTAAPNPEPRTSASAGFIGEGNLKQKARGKAKAKRCAKGKVRSKKGRCVKAKRKAKANRRADKNGRAGR